MTDRMTYSVRAVYAPDDLPSVPWYVEIPGIGATQAVDEDDVPVMARDYIALALGVPEGSFDLDVVFDRG